MKIKRTNLREFKYTPKISYVAHRNNTPVYMINKSSGRVYRILTCQIQRTDGNLGDIFKYKDYNSVTTILDKIKNPALDAWKELVGEETANHLASVAAARGSKLHELCEAYINNYASISLNVNKFGPDVKSMFKSIQPWLNRVHEPEVIETPVWSHNWKFAGTPDLICRYNIGCFPKGPVYRPAIVDYKNASSDITLLPDAIEKYFMQAAAYSIAYAEMIDEPPIDLGIIIVGSLEYGPKIFARKLGPYRKKFLELIS